MAPQEAPGVAMPNGNIDLLRANIAQLARMMILDDVGYGRG